MTDHTLLAAALLHDTIEDTETTFEELEERFGSEVRGLVEEVTDDKSLPKSARKELQVTSAPTMSDAAKQLEIADKTCNVRDIAKGPPAGWSRERQAEYVEFATRVVAGGILIFGMAWSMLQARRVESKQTELEEEEAQRSGASDSVAIVPLAIPLLAGPGAISLMILAAARTQSRVEDATAIWAAFLVSVSIFLVLRSAERIAAVLSQTGMNVATRLMGLILAALAVELISNGVIEKFPGLVK